MAESVKSAGNGVSLSSTNGATTHPATTAPFARGFHAPEQAPTPAAVERCGAILYDIAEGAGHIQRLVRLLADRLGPDDTLATDALASSVHTLAGRLGWLADVAHADLIQGAPVSCSTEAGFWLLSPHLYGALPPGSSDANTLRAMLRQPVALAGDGK